MNRLAVALLASALVVTSVVGAGCIEQADDAGERGFDSKDEAPAENYSHLLTEPPEDAVEVEVVEVVDADTFHVRYPDGSRDTVRVVGVDAPETHGENQPEEYPGVSDTGEAVDCLRGWGHNATEHAERRLADRNVSIAFDPVESRRGGYDRLLTYVYVDDELYGLQLVERGLARVYTESPFVLKQEFEEAEHEAREADRGLWRCT